MISSKIMIRYISLALALLMLTSAPLLFGCSSQKPDGEDNTSSLSADLDYSKFSDTVLYDVMMKFSDAGNIGKTVKMRAEYGGVFNFASNTYINVIEQYDATACCAAYYEIRLADGVSRPAIGSEVEIVGEFCEGYINVTALTLINGVFDNTVIDVDASNMTRDQLDEFLKECEKIGNGNTNKTVRICGHYAKSKDGFNFLIGYEEDSNKKLQSTWQIELHSETVKFPEITDNYIYAYEVIGKVSSYQTEDGRTWPCIEVASLRQITTYSVKP